MSKKYFYINFDHIGKIYRISFDKLNEIKPYDGEQNMMQYFDSFDWKIIKEHLELYKEYEVNMNWEFANADVCEGDENRPGVFLKKELNK